MCNFSSWIVIIITKETLKRVTFFKYAIISDEINYYQYNVNNKYINTYYYDDIIMIINMNNEYLNCTILNECNLSIL